MSTAKFNTWLNPNGTENYKCRAWVNFNGVTTATIRASGNVSSVTRNGAGDYTVNFTTALPDANYSVAGMGVQSPNNHIVALSSATAPTSSAVRLNVFQSGGSLADSLYVLVAIFR
jgi:hypothetical protein